MSKPTILETNLVATSRLFKVETVDLEFSNGEKRQFERLKSSGRGAVMIIPIINDEEFLLIKEYSVGVEDYQLCFPKGLVDPGEQSEQAANRELQEEVGFAANQIEFLYNMTLAPGYFSHRMDIYVAYDLYESKLEGDEPEPLEVIRWRFDQVDALLAREDFTESRSIAALLLFIQQRKSKQG